MNYEKIIVELLSRIQVLEEQMETLLASQNKTTEGLQAPKITTEDTEYASKFNSVIKLIGLCQRVGDKYSVVVSPMLVDSESPLFGVDGVFNGIMVSGNMLGDALFYGRGAGKLPTASAVVADVIDIAKNKGDNFKAPWLAETKNVLVPYEEIKTAMYIRVETGDVASAIDYIEKSFGKDLKCEITACEFAVITPVDTIANIQKIAAGIPGKVLSQLMVL